MTSDVDIQAVQWIPTSENIKPNKMKFKDTWNIDANTQKDRDLNNWRTQGYPWKSCNLDKSVMCKLLHTLESLCSQSMSAQRYHAMSTNLIFWKK